MFKAALDTSSAHAAFAVMADDSEKPVINITDVPLGRQSGSLPGRVKAALCEHNLDLSSIQHWTIGMGPGSFTGIRVGAAFVKGLCAGSTASYRGVQSSLAMVMTAAPASAKTAIALHDGRRAEVLVSPYHRPDGEWVPSEPPYPLKISEIPALASDCIVILKNDRALQDVQTVCAGLVILDGFPVEQLIRAKPSFTPETTAEQEDSCNPVYVRPAVFVEPTLKKSTHTPTGETHEP